MIVYLASPRNRHQLERITDMPVLLSYACYSKMTDEYQQTFSRILVDSGAYSELNSGVKVDLNKYIDWARRWDGHADAIAGLDDISGDWRRSLRNYEAFPSGFPTFHDTDPPKLLDDLLAMAKERDRWIGLGLKPPREGKGRWVAETCARIPAGFHVHGWALRRYTKVRRIDSVDSTNWFRDVMKLRILPALAHLTDGECLDIVVKRYQRWERTLTNSRFPHRRLKGEARG